MTTSSEAKDPFVNVDQPADVIQELRLFAQKCSGFALLSGANGVGKTYLAKAVLESFSWVDSPPWYLRRKFIKETELKRRWLNDLEKWNSTNLLLENLCEARVLIIDDLGVIREPTPAFLDFLYEVVDFRWEYRKDFSTLITTNLNSKDLRLKYGDAICSRIASDIVFRLEGKDRRFKEF